jgi:hypothetical protein
VYERVRNALRRAHQRRNPVPEGTYGRGDVRESVAGRAAPLMERMDADTSRALTTEQVASLEKTRRVGSGPGAAGPGAARGPRATGAGARQKGKRDDRSTSSSSSELGSDDGDNDDYEDNHGIAACGDDDAEDDPDRAGTSHGASSTCKGSPVALSHLSWIMSRCVFLASTVVQFLMQRMAKLSCTPNIRHPGHRREVGLEAPRKLPPVAKKGLDRSCCWLLCRHGHTNSTLFLYHNNGYDSIKAHRTSVKIVANTDAVGRAAGLSSTHATIA